MTRDAGFKRRVRARMARTGEKYAAARAVLDTPHDEPQPAVDTADTDPAGGTVLHVTNGDATVDVLRGAGLSGPILPWRDVLHDGPVPGSLPDNEFRAVRAEFLAGRAETDRAQVLGSFTERDRTLDANTGGEYVLWFEADLYDQLQIVQIVARLRRLGVDPARITLVSAGEYPGIAHFGGLGELSPEELMSLYPEGVRLGPEATAVADRAWSAFTAPDPSGLGAAARIASPELRYVGEAFGRIMQEYPARSDGLSLLQRRILLVIEDGATTAGEAFGEVGRRERRPYVGDHSLYAAIEALASGPHPLLVVDGSPEPYARRAVRLTRDGEEVLAGRADHVRLNGIDRWIGGVHLVGTESAWRYDERRETLVAT